MGSGIFGPAWLEAHDPWEERSVFKELLIMSLAEKATTSFLNVDLDRGGQCDLEELLGHLGSDVLVMNKADKFMSLELNEPYLSLDETLVKWIELIERLPSAARKIWDQCEFRTMNIGIQGGVEPHEAHFTISRKTISLLPSSHAEIMFTVYAPPA
jgi:hypothetical protein